MTSLQHRTALAFLASFEHLDGAANIALRTPDCTHTMAPSSLNFPPSMTNDQWAAHLSGIKEIISHLPVTPKEIFESESESGSRQVTIWATSNAVFREEGKDLDGEDEDRMEWRYQGEYIFILVFGEGGKIERILEFLDSKRVEEVSGLIERARRNLEKRREGEGKD